MVHFLPFMVFNWSGEGLDIPIVGIISSGQNQVSVVSPQSVTAYQVTSNGALRRLYESRSPIRIAHAVRDRNRVLLIAIDGRILKQEGGAIVPTVIKVDVGTIHGVSAANGIACVVGERAAARVKLRDATVEYIKYDNLPASTSGITGSLVYFGSMKGWIWRWDAVRKGRTLLNIGHPIRSIISMKGSQLLLTAGPNVYSLAMGRQRKLSRISSAGTLATAGISVAPNKLSTIVTYHQPYGPDSVGPLGGKSIHSVGALRQVLGRRIIHSTTPHAAFTRGGKFIATYSGGELVLTLID
jgi:hypothetical protein